VKRSWRDEVLPPYHLKIEDADHDGTYHQKIALRLVAGCIFCAQKKEWDRTQEPEELVATAEDNSSLFSSKSNHGDDEHTNNMVKQYLQD
jgi:hypothetical protein